MATAVKKAKPKQELKLPVFNYDLDGEYYRATVGDVKICGQIFIHSSENDNLEMSLQNSQGFGEPNECDSRDYLYDGDVNVSWEGDEYNADAVRKEFQRLGITSFSVTNDKRMIEAIDRTKFGLFNGDWSITVNSSGDISFGCGEVELSLDEIKEFIRVQTLINNIKSRTYHNTVESIRDNISPEDVDLDEAAELVKKVEALLEVRAQLKKTKKKK